MFNWIKAASPSKPKTLGQLGEERAQEEYKKQGFEIIAQNEFNKKGLRLGEIDFVAKSKSKLVFVEVKTRSLGKNRFGTAVESVNQFKQIKLLRAVKVFMLKHAELSGLVPQIDVCVLHFDEVDKTFKPAIIIPNAVEDWN